MSLKLGFVAQVQNIVSDQVYVEERNILTLWIYLDIHTEQPQDLVIPLYCLWALTISEVTVVVATRQLTDSQSQFLVLCCRYGCVHFIYAITSPVNLTYENLVKSRPGDFP